LESGFGIVFSSINWCFPSVFPPILHLHLAHHANVIRKNGKSLGMFKKPTLFRKIIIIGGKVFLTLFEGLLNFNTIKVRTNSLKTDDGCTALDSIYK